MHIPAMRTVSRMTLMLLLLVSTLGCTAFKGMMGMEDDGIIDYEFVPDFSVNLAYVSPEWPEDPTLLIGAEKQIYEEKGAPDLVHLWWDRRAPIISDTRYYRLRTALRGKMQPRRITWVYSDLNEEVFFTGTEKHEIEEIGDKFQIIIEYGDPQRVQEIELSDDRFQEKWTYYNAGRSFIFVDGEKVDEHRFQAVPNYGGR